MTKTKTILKLLEDSIAAIVILSLIVFLGVSIISFSGASLSSIPATWLTLYSLLIMMSAVKLYGKKVYDAVKGAAMKVGGAGP